MTTKPTTIQGRWDQFVLESVSSDSEVLSLLILKRAFLNGVANGMDLLDDRVGGCQREMEYKVTFRLMAEELMDEVGDTAVRMVRELGKHQENTEEKS